MPALEGVAKEATDIQVTPGTEVVREGDYGDCYYAIADGLLEVSKDGRAVAQLSRGEGFGEIALLHDYARTATVTAVTPARLVAVERESFLVAVTGHGETRTRFQDVALQRLAETPPDVVEGDYGGDLTSGET